MIFEAMTGSELLTPLYRCMGWVVGRINELCQRRVHVTRTLSAERIAGAGMGCRRHPRLHGGWGGGLDHAGGFRGGGALDLASPPAETRQLGEY